MWENRSDIIPGHRLLWLFYSASSSESCPRATWTTGTVGMATRTLMIGLQEVRGPTASMVTATLTATDTHTDTGNERDFLLTSREAILVADSSMENK